MSSCYHYKKTRNCLCSIRGNSSEIRLNYYSKRRAFIEWLIFNIESKQLIRFKIYLRNEWWFKIKDFYLIRHDNCPYSLKSVLWKYNIEKHQRNSLRIYCISITNMTADFNCMTFTNGETSMQRDLAEGPDMSLCVWSCRVRPHHIIPLQVLHPSWETAEWSEGMFLK